MSPRDIYQTLGVRQAATTPEIRQAFRDLARRYHPDLHPNDARARDRFNEIKEAYDILSDPARRRDYDAQNLIPDEYFYAPSSPLSLLKRVPTDLGSFGSQLGISPL